MLLQMELFHSFFYGWVIFHCTYVPHLPYPFLCRWTFRLLPCPRYCKLCCNEHWGTCFFLNYVLQKSQPMEETMLGPLERREKYFPSQKSSRDLWFPGAFFSLAMPPGRLENLRKEVCQVYLKSFRFHTPGFLPWQWFPCKCRATCLQNSGHVTLRGRFYIPKMVTMISSILHTHLQCGLAYALSKSGIDFLSPWILAGHMTLL